MSVRRSVRVRAFAKINLTLRVLGVRADRLSRAPDHLSVDCAARHADVHRRAGPVPHRMRRPRVSERSDQSRMARGGANVARREPRRGAARRRGACREAHSNAGRVGRRQQRRGGDAAGARRAVAGADVVRQHAVDRVGGWRRRTVFLEGGTALGLERGDLLFPLLDAPASWVVLAIPDFGVSTSEAYGWFDRDRKAVGLRRGRAEVRAGNDLQAVVSRRHPEIRRLVSALSRRGASQAALSGSGSAVFGLFGSRAAAASTARALASRTRRTLVTRTLDRARYMRGWRASGPAKAGHYD